jgi:transcriptional regulator with XRE-family HTH domain
MEGGDTVQYFDQVQRGERIKKIRELRGMKQIVLATKLGYSSERQLQGIEAGESACNSDKIMELSQILNISTDYLLFGKEFGLSADNNEVVTYLSDKTPQEQAFALNILKSIFENKQLLVS